MLAIHTRQMVLYVSFSEFVPVYMHDSFMSIMRPFRLLKLSHNGFITVMQAEFFSSPIQYREKH